MGESDSAAMSDAADNYLRRIYLIAESSAQALVSMGSLAETMGVAPGSATAMVKKLAQLNLVSYEPYAGVRLSAKGRRRALDLVRRHRLIEAFLVESLGLDWSEIHDEAEQLEHAISDRVLDRVDALLGHPSVDPHGDPIPDARGGVRERPTRTLVDCDRGDRIRVVRVLDQDREFLQFLSRNELRPGSRVLVEAIDRPGDAISLRIGARVLTLGGAAARKLLVETVAA